MSANHSIPSMTAPQERAGKWNLRDDLAVSSLVRRSLKSFSAVTGLPVILAPPHLIAKALSFGKQDNEFCRCLWNSGGCVECGLIQKELYRRLNGKFKAHWINCGAGIIQFGVPVIVGGRNVATLLGGKARVQPADDGQLKAFVNGLGVERTQEELHELGAAYSRSPALTMSQLRKSLSLLDSLARLFGEAIAKHPSQVPSADPPYLAKAKAYVQQHLGERLSTRQLADVLHLSEAYFCRLFRRLTGVTCRAYVAQARVETAKTRLLSSGDTITEIGYVAGFQSVSDFNRVFKSNVGTSPSEFRRRAGRMLVKTRSSGH